MTCDLSHKEKKRPGGGSFFVPIMDVFIFSITILTIERNHLIVKCCMVTIMFTLFHKDLEGGSPQQEMYTTQGSEKALQSLHGNSSRCCFAIHDSEETRQISERASNGRTYALHSMCVESDVLGMSASDLGTLSKCHANITQQREC